MGSYKRTEAYDEFKPNFLASEVGLITKTYEISDTGVSAGPDGRKIVKAGTVYPKNDGTAVGIVFKDIDVTYGPRDGAVIIAGRVYKNRIKPAVESAAVPVLEKRGIYFDDMPETTR